MIHEENFTSLPNNSAHDGRGHGTFVASIAAGSGAQHAGVAPNADIVSLDVVDDNGMGLTSDVIAAADWILANKNTYDIRVANFSLHGSQPAHVPLRPARQSRRAALVQRRRRRHGGGQLRRDATRSPLRPRQRSLRDHGRRGRPQRLDRDAERLRRPVVRLRLDARRLREAGAVGARPVHGRRHPDRLDAGRRKAGPARRARIPAHVGHVVRGARRRRHRRVHPRPAPRLHSGPGQGSADGDRAPDPERRGRLDRRRRGRGGQGVRGRESAEPEPCARPIRRPGSDGGAGRVFDEATWTTYAAGNPAWDAATWTTATWTTATWTTATWTTAAWQAATWVSATWTTATWTTATWTTATWTTSNDATWTTSAESEANATSGEFFDPAEKSEAEDALGITPNP